MNDVLTNVLAVLSLALCLLGAKLIGDLEAARLAEQQCRMHGTAAPVNSATAATQTEPAT